MRANKIIGQTLLFDRLLYHCLNFYINCSIVIVIREAGRYFLFSTMSPKPTKIVTAMEHRAERFTQWIGSPASIVLHTIAFAAAFVLVWFGVAFETVLLVLTTAVSLEAIYLALFIQMTVNRNTKSLEEVEEDIDEIQEDVEEIEKDIDKLEEEDVKDNLHDVATVKTLDVIQKNLQRLMQDIQALKEQKK